MVTKTNEQALEAGIKKALTGTCREQLRLEGWGCRRSQCALSKRPSVLAR